MIERRNPAFISHADGADDLPASGRFFLAGGFYFPTA
jgi:hypothetical protein